MMPRLLPSQEWLHLYLYAPFPHLARLPLFLLANHMETLYIIYASDPLFIRLLPLSCSLQSCPINPL